MTMTVNRYIPTWERKYDRWETEPDANLDFLDEDTLEIDEDELDDLKSLAEIDELEFADEEFDLDIEQTNNYISAISFGNSHLYLRPFRLS